MHLNRAHTSKESRLQRNWRPFYIAVSIATDLAAVICTIVASYLIRDIFFSVPPLEPEPLIAFSLFFAGTFLGVALLTGLYREAYRTTISQQKRSAAKTYTYASYVILFVVYLVFGGKFLPRFTILFLGLLPIVYYIGRRILRSWTRRMHARGYGRYNTLLVNLDQSSKRPLDRFTILPELGYSIRGVLCRNNNIAGCSHAECGMMEELSRVRSSVPANPQQPPQCFGLHEMESTLKTLFIERVIVAQVESARNGFGEILKLCREQNVHLKVISRESEQLLRFSSVKDLTGIPLYTPPRRITNEIKARLKRVFDLAVALPLLLLLSPVFILIAMAILIEDGGPVFFRQKRGLSFHGRKFMMLKFRSMEDGAEEKLRDLKHLNEAEQGLFLVRGDPRLTWVGRWIRKGSLDELPQLINVVRGEMSLVGPRPLAMHDLEAIENEALYSEYYRMREKVRPGMTGLWQISGRREIPPREMVFLDLYYIDNHSIAFDMEILFATIPVIAFGRGAY